MASWYLAPSLAALRTQANARWPNRSKASDGTIGDAAHAARTSDHNPKSDGKGGMVVDAFDLTNDPGVGLDAHRWVRDRCAAGDPRIKYAISNAEIWTGERGWVRYTGSNAHRAHVHVSVKATDAARRDTSPWFPPIADTPQPTAIVINAGPTYEDATMQPHFVSLHSGGARLDGNGNGYWDLPQFPFDRTVTVNPNVANPPEGGYNVPDVGFLRWGNGIRVVAEEAVAGGGLDVVIWVAGP